MPGSFFSSFFLSLSFLPPCLGDLQRLLFALSHFILDFDISHVTQVKIQVNLINDCFRYSPNIKEIKILGHRKVRRARLYYLRDKLPKFSTFK